MSISNGQLSLDGHVIIFYSIYFVLKGPCAEWISVQGAKVMDSLFQPRIYTEDECKEICAQYSDCDAVNWVTEGSYRCYLHDGIGSSAPLPKSASNYWKIYRTRECDGRISDY